VINPEPSCNVGHSTFTLFKDLTNSAVASVVRDHRLSDVDAPLVMHYARDRVRAYLLAELLNST
jgi:hypothetical protein